MAKSLNEAEKRSVVEAEAERAVRALKTGLALEFVVRGRGPGQAYFEPLAAFNWDDAAIDYANRCAAGKEKGWRYEVRDGYDRHLYSVNGQ